MNEENSNQTNNSFDSKHDRRTPPGEGQPKQLYKIHEGALISGVCSGLGVYFNIDPTVIRIAFVILAIITHGLGILVYIFMMILVPYAKNAEDYARAHGDKVNPYGEERRHEIPHTVNSREYWKKFSNEQIDYWREFLFKFFAPIREYFKHKSSK